MPQLHCPNCRGTMRQTKRLQFPDGGIKLVYECQLCQRALIEDQDPDREPTETT